VSRGGRVDALAVERLTKSCLERVRAIEAPPAAKTRRAVRGRRAGYCALVWVPRPLSPPRWLPRLCGMAGGLSFASGTSIPPVGGKSNTRPGDLDWGSFWETITGCPAERCPLAQAGRRRNRPSRQAVRYPGRPDPDNPWSKSFRARGGGWRKRSGRDPPRDRGTPTLPGQRVARGRGLAAGGGAAASTGKSPPRSPN
jgi:hypothetical protein